MNRKMSGWIPSNSISTHCTYHQTWLSGCSAVFSAADRAGKFILPHSAHLKPQHLRLTFTFVWLGPQLSYVFVPFGHHPLVLLHPAVSGAADNVGQCLQPRLPLRPNMVYNRRSRACYYPKLLTQRAANRWQQHRGKGKFLQPQPGVEILREARNTI